MFDKCVPTMRFLKWSSKVHHHQMANTKECCSKACNSFKNLYSVKPSMQHKVIKTSYENQTCPWAELISPHIHSLI